MEKVTWDQSLSVGVAIIDQQHQSLIDRLNAMSAAIEQCQGDREIAGALAFLIEYTEFHFTAEEKHMAGTEYPGLDAQRAQHEQFKATLRRLEEDFEEEGSTKALAESIDTFLANWLVTHIRGIDTKFGAFLTDGGITLTDDA